MNLFGRLGLLAAAGAVLGVTGCGSVNGTTTTGHAGRPGSTPAATAGGLCAAASKVDSLTVIRHDAIPRNHLRFRFPPRVTTSRPQAQAVARAVCALPRMPRGTMACPADWGVSYRLEFATAGRRFGVVTVDASGCQPVSGAGPMRWLVRTHGFWTVLERATGMPGPSAFFGCGGSAGLMCPAGATGNP
jgi:hypothetical protein